MAIGTAWVSVLAVAAKLGAGPMAVGSLFTRSGQARKHTDPPEGEGLWGTEEAALQALRERHKVRPLRALEEGFGTGQLPGGVFGFTFSPGDAEAPLFRNHLSLAFEIHKLRDGGTVLLAFVSPEAAASVANLDNLRTEQHIHVFPRAAEQATELVGIPTSRVGRFKDYEPERVKGLEIMLVPPEDSGRGETPPSFRLEHTFPTVPRA